MGFNFMNSSRHFDVSCSEANPELTKPIDVIAIDDEVGTKTEIRLKIYTKIFQSNIMKVNTHRL